MPTDRERGEGKVFLLCYNCQFKCLNCSRQHLSVLNTVFDATIYIHVAYCDWPPGKIYEYIHRTELLYLIQVLLATYILCLWLSTISVKDVVFVSLKNHEVCRVFSQQVYPSVSSSTSGASFRSTSFYFFLLLYLYSWHCLKIEHLFMFSTFSRLVFPLGFFCFVHFHHNWPYPWKKCYFNCS